jgi:hypothetical protein
MPFPIKPFIFDEYTIRQLAPTGPGVYGIANSESWIYIGLADNLEGALLRHLSLLDTNIEEQNPTLFAWEKSLATDRAARKIALIQELKPLLLTLAAR